MNGGFVAVGEVCGEHVASGGDDGFITGEARAAEEEGFELRFEVVVIGGGFGE